MTDKKTIVDWALHWEAQSPDVLHFIQPRGGGAANIKTWSYGQAVQEARRMASYLLKLGLPPKSRVAICSKNCAHWILADWAIWMAGHVSVPLYPTLAPNVVRYILEHSESKLLFVGKLDPIWNEMKVAVPAGIEKISFPLAPPSDHPRWDDIVAKHEPLAQPVRRGFDEMATIIYTSGSTGQPKGVMLSFGALEAATAGISNLLGIDQSDRMLSHLPMAHTMERWLVGCGSTRAAFQVFFTESADTFMHDLKRARPTLFISVPRLWSKFQAGVFERVASPKLERLLRVPLLGGLVKKKVLEGLGLDAVRFAGSGSAPIPAELLAWYRKLGLELLEGYGMSENFNYSHVTKPGQVRVGYVGSPYDGVECKLGEGAEILVKSPATMIGYLKQPGESREAFTLDGFLRTGDCGTIDELGRLKITGRIKEIFKTSKGKYVAPSPIENRLLDHPLVEQCCVSGTGQPQPFGLIVLSEEARGKAHGSGKQPIEAELIQHLERVNEELDSVERLQFLSVVGNPWSAENGLLTPSLKIRRAKIEEAYGPRVASWYAQNKKLVWSDSLGR